MPDNQRNTLAGTTVTLYRNHCGLFWRIVIPVAVIAIILEISMFYQVVTQLENDKANIDIGVPTANVNTISGIHPTVTGVIANKKSSGVSWQFFLIPSFHSTDDKGVTWKWDLNFRSIDYSALILLLLTLCPLSLAVERLSGSSQISEVVETSTPPTAREMWRYTGRKALMVLGAALLFLLIKDVPGYLYVLVLWLIPSLTNMLFMGLTITLIIAFQTYCLVTLSLYNPCLILESNSIIGIFRRSHALIRGARLRFFGIYLLTGWIASVITSVLLGVTLLVFSVFIPDLAQVREALPPLKFLSLFIGGDIEIVLPQLLSVPATVAILIVKGLIATLLVPIWAILTTLLYLERVRVKPDPIKEAV